MSRRFAVRGGRVLPLPTHTDVSSDGYPHSVSNRTVFPLSGGVISLTSEHPVWTRTSVLHHRAPARI